MKKILILAVAVCAASVASAQKMEAVKLGLVEKEGTYSYFTPKTVMKVTVTLQKESVRKGPYSRYAQKYLGVIAPLADKDYYRIESVQVNYNDPNSDLPGRLNDSFVSQTKETEPVVKGNINNSTGFPRLPLNVTAQIRKSEEEMASDAAAAIFSIRKNRSQLISGDAGENVFGAGLAAALDEYARQEEEYLALFFGRQYTQQITRSFYVTPESQNRSYVVCKISESEGFTTGNGSGDLPLSLTFYPEKPDFEAEPDRKSVV